ncbi:hypothetical protein Tco_0656247 [Tanacetum coccineum]|uniref:Uncharacterized protein n=1 Tax=Tanacetum coccineum TaxID=301880 RepID=A0ABQ4X8W9_9ASTR
MNDPNITMEEYIKLEEEKDQSRGEMFNWQITTFGRTRHYYEEDTLSMNFKEEYQATSRRNKLSYYGMLPLLIINLYVSYRIPFDPKRYYKDGSHTNVAEAKISLDPVEHDMAPLTAVEQRHPWLRYKVEGYTPGSGGEATCSRFILDFLSTYRMNDTEMGLVVVDTLCFQLGGARRRMTWRQFILALGLHTKQEMAEARDFLGPAPSYGQAPEKVTGVDLFYLRNMDHGTTNVPHLLAQYLFRHSEGRKSEARLSGGHFIGLLAMHFGLVSDEGLRGLQVVNRELALIDLHELRGLISA